MDNLQLILTIIVYGFVFIGWMATFYLIGQWLVFRKRRYRFRVCKPFLAIGWVLWLVGGSVLYPLGKVQNSTLLILLGVLIAFLGVGLTIFSAIRFWRKVIEEGRAEKMAEVSEQPGVWPPPPKKIEE